MTMRRVIYVLLVIAGVLRCRCAGDRDELQDQRRLRGQRLVALVRPRSRLADARRAAGAQRSRVKFVRWTINSVVVTACVVAGRVVLCLARRLCTGADPLPGYKLVFGLVLSVMMIPGIVLAIPKFLVLKQLGWINTYAGLIIPLVFDAFAVFLMKQFMEQIPIEIEEARGHRRAGRWQTFTKVVFPIARPAVVTLAILGTVGAWNEFLHP